jgi:hypothetical protein
MVRWSFILTSGFAVVFAATAVRADSGPVIVIPSRPGIPIVINGQDASYAVVEGDWGLARPGAVPVTVIGGTPVLPNPVYTRRNSYHPRYGRPPPRGRNEIEPPPDRELPEPAENFSRSWSTSSDPTPVNDQGPSWPSVEPPYDPSITVVPNINRKRPPGIYPPDRLHPRRDRR